MSILSFIADDLFVIRIVKRLLTNPDNQWANTYEVRAVIPGSADELLALAVKLLDMEKDMHLPGVQFASMSVSTWEADSVPYNPDVFLSSALSAVGLRAGSGAPVALSSCLSVARVPLSGRLGHLFYRGVLTEGDVEAPAGKDVLTDSAAMTVQFASAREMAGVDDALGVAASPLELVMVSKTGGNVRPVIGLVPVGISRVPTDHVWYNRTTPTP